MNNITNNNIAQAIYLSTKDKSAGEMSNVYKNIVNFLAKKNLISKSSDILKKLKKIINDENGIFEAKVFTARKLNDTSKKELKHILQNHYKTTEVDLVEILDPKLLGGLRIEINDEVIDNTIKNKINKLKNHLIK